MDIYEMHVLFRTLGQQQGLQLVRGILPESIDEFLNEAINQTARVTILSNVQPTKDSRTPQYTKVSPLNALHTLYCTEEQDIVLIDRKSDLDINLEQTPLIVTNFSIEYKDGSIYDCRIIERERLYKTLNDYLNRASHDYPIVSLVNGKYDKEFRLSLFTGENLGDVAKIITNYIRMPKSVKYDEAYYDYIETHNESETGYNPPENTSINCDLPEHLHRSIVELAVELWFQTHGLSSRQPQDNNNNKNSQ